jgi:hypothetical protein
MTRPDIVERREELAAAARPGGEVLGRQDCLRLLAQTNLLQIPNQGHRLGAQRQGRQCEIMGQTLGAGSYVHIPPGVEHDVVAVGPEGATIFYLYIDELGDAGPHSPL